MRSYFKSTPLGEQVDAADAVRALLAHPGWSHVTALVDAEIADLDARLDADKPLESRADYASLHGQRRGLAALAGLAHAIVSKTDERLAEEHARNRAADAALQGAR